MLSIAPIGRGQERYYLNKVANGAEEYYTHAGEAPGRWWGGGASALGLSGVVGEDDIAAVLDGINPDDHVALVSGAGTERRRVGFDLTLSAPKGVSLLAMMGPSEIAAVASAAHEDAVAQALRYLEANAAFARRGHGGAKRMETSGLVCAGFVHRTSRAADPQLHTHVLVANLVHGNDGHWSSLDARGLFGYGRTAGFVYQAVLRANLTRDLGLAWAPVRSGMAEPAGFDAAQLKAFSTRRAQIEEALDVYGASSAKAAQVAAWRTRAEKDLSITPESLAQRWADRAGEVGLDQEVMASMRGPGRSTGLGPTTGEVFAQLLSPAGLTAADAAFDQRDVIRALAESAPDGLSLDELTETAAVLLAHPEVVALGASDPRTATPLYSTTDMLAIEAALLAGAQRRRSASTAIVPQSVLDAVIGARPSLADEQADMVRSLTTSGAGIEVVMATTLIGRDADRSQIDGAAVIRQEAESARLGTTLLPTLVPDPATRITAWETEREGVQAVLGPDTGELRDTGGLPDTGETRNSGDAPDIATTQPPRSSTTVEQVPDHVKRWVSDELARLDTQGAELDRARRARDAWEAEHADELTALADLRAGLDRTKTALGRAMVVTPPAHLVEMLGPVPLRNGPRAEWAAAAVDVETYRARFAIDIASPDLGKRPPAEQSLQSAAWEATMRAVEIVRGRGGLDSERNGPEMDVGRSR